VAAILRSGLIASLTSAIPHAVSIATDTNKSGRTRLRAMRGLRQIERAGLHLSPVGLQLARWRASGGPEPADEGKPRLRRRGERALRRRKTRPRNQKRRGRHVLNFRVMERSDDHEGGQGEFGTTGREGDHECL
jgi:hypothetical protein